MCSRHPAIVAPQVRNAWVEVEAAGSTKKGLLCPSCVCTPHVTMQLAQVCGSAPLFPFGPFRPGSGDRGWPRSIRRGVRPARTPLSLLRSSPADANSSVRTCRTVQVIPADELGHAPFSECQANPYRNVRSSISAAWLTFDDPRSVVAMCDVRCAMLRVR